MIGRASSFLGLAFGDRGIACAEVSAGGDHRSVKHFATFPFTADLSLEKPDATGLALAAFLREKRFASSRVVAGVPARWLIATEKEIPPANELQARAALKLQAERVGGGDGHELVFDFAGKPNSQSPSRVLLVGIVKQQFERVQRILDVAGLSVVAITSTGLALASTLKQSDENGAMLLLSAAGAEVVIRGEGIARTLRHISMTTTNGHGPAVAPLGSELRRALAMSNGTTSARRLLLLDGIGLEPSQVGELSTRSGVEIQTTDELKLIGVTADPGVTTRSNNDPPRLGGYIACAASLALAGNKPDALPLDFAHSRLAVASTRKLGRTAILGIAAAIFAIVGIVYLIEQGNKSQHDLDYTNSRLKTMEQQTAGAQVLVDHVNYASGYYDQRPDALECLRQITLTFHDDEKIWVTSFTLRDNGKGSLAGKAADQDTVLKMWDRLKKNSNFSGIERLDTHPADTRSSDWVFSLNFTYNFTR